MNSATPPSQAPARALWPWLALAVILLFVGGIRWRLADLPLERDEGEYAYMGQLMLQGIPPYQQAYNMKLPGTYAGYAALMAVFGETTRGVHLGLLVVNAAAIVFTFLLGRRLFGVAPGLFAAAAYGLLSTSPRVMGLAAHATHFVVLPALAATLCLLQASETSKRRWYFASGLLYGVAFLMKQQGVFFGVFGFGWIIFEAWRQRPINVPQLTQRAGLYALGCALPFALTCLALWQAGVFKMFWFWTFDYARAYVSEVSLMDGLRLFLGQGGWVAGANWTLLLLAVTGFVGLWQRRSTPAHEVFLTAFLVASFATICPGLFFRDHYFITLLPAVALLGGAGWQCLHDWLATRTPPARHLACAAAAFAFALPLWLQRDVFFVLTPLQACREIHNFGPFPESIEIAKYLRDHTAPNARIAVVGSEPQIYFYSQRKSATGFIYTYGLVEEQPFALQMQQQMIQEIENAKPEYIVYVDLGNSWQTHAKAPRLIFEWLGSYCAAHYDMVGAVDMVSLTQTDYHWGEAARTSPRKSERNIFIVKRRAAAQ